MSAKDVHRQPRASGWTEDPAWPRGTGCAPRAVRSAAEQGIPGTAQALAGPCAAHRALPPALPLPAGQGLRTPQSSARSSPSHSLPWPPLPGPFPPPVRCFSPGVAGPRSTVPPRVLLRRRLSRAPGAPWDGAPARDPLRLTGWHSVCPPGAHSLGDTQTRQTQPAARRAPSSRGTFCKEGRPGLDPGREKAASLGAMRAGHARRPPYTPTTCHSLTSRENSLPVTNTCAPRKRANLRCRAQWCRKN